MDKSIRTVHQISFFPRFFPVNCYLIEEDSELTLIDAALPFSTDKIISAAKALGKPITRIVLTHGHSDHIGALDGLKNKYPALPVYISRRDSRLLSGDRSLDKGEPDAPIRGGVLKNFKVQADFLLEDGDRIGSLIAIATPGHTPGSMSFLDTRNQSLIAGDAFQTKAGVAVSGQLNPLFPFPALATWHKQTALRSAKKLLALDPAILAVGHGNMITNPKEEIKTAINKAEKNLS